MVKINSILLALALAGSSVASSRCLADEADIIGEDWMSEIDFRYNGPILYFGYGF